MPDVTASYVFSAFLANFAPILDLKMLLDRTQQDIMLCL